MNGVATKATARDYQGTVKWFNDEKGYGFIGRDDGVDVFVHRSGIDRDGNGVRFEMSSGSRVEFDVEEGRKGLQAAHVRPVE